MKITYRPDGGAEQVWAYLPDKFPYAEAELVEEILDCTTGQFSERVIAGGARARRALLWVLMRRDKPNLRFSDVQLNHVGELLVEYDGDEIAKMRAEVMKNDDLEDDDRKTLLKVFDDMEFKGITDASQSPKEDPKKTEAAPSDDSA